MTFKSDQAYRNRYEQVEKLMKDYHYAMCERSQ